VRAIHICLKKLITLSETASTNYNTRQILVSIEPALYPTTWERLSASETSQPGVSKPIRVNSPRGFRGSEARDWSYAHNI